jgi:hypothetical protein
MSIFKFDTLHAGVLTIDRDTWDLTIGELVFEGATFRPQGTKSEEEDAAVLLGFYSAYAESARSEQHRPGHIEAEYGPDYFTAEQWAALDAVGEDMFWTWADELAPSCATGCSAFAIVEDSEGLPYCARCAVGTPR